MIRILLLLIFISVSSLGQNKDEVLKIAKTVLGHEYLIEYSNTNELNENCIGWALDSINYNNRDSLFFCDQLLLPSNADNDSICGKIIIKIIPIKNKYKVTVEMKPKGSRVIGKCSHYSSLFVSCYAKFKNGECRLIKVKKKYFYRTAMLL